jgi:uncharacterized coiled-coil protein SlyX
MADNTAEQRERDIIAAYRAGEKVTVIEARFNVGRSTLYHLLHREGIKPGRSRTQVEAASGDARLAGLAELISHQDRLIQELQANAAAMKKRIAKLERENDLLRSRDGAGDGHRRKRTVS